MGPDAPATEDEPSPYEVVADERVFKLRHYYVGTNDGAPASLLVPPLMLAAEVYDVSRRSSAVTILHEHGSIRGWSTSARPSA